MAVSAVSTRDGEGRGAAGGAGAALVTAGVTGLASPQPAAKQAAPKIIGTIGPRMALLRGIPTNLTSPRPLRSSTETPSERKRNRRDTSRREPFPALPSLHGS